MFDSLGLFHPSCNRLPINSFPGSFSPKEERLGWESVLSWAAFLSFQSPINLVSKFFFHLPSIISAFFLTPTILPPIWSTSRSIRNNDYCNFPKPIFHLTRPNSLIIVKTLPTHHVTIAIANSETEFHLTIFLGSSTDMFSPPPQPKMYLLSLCTLFICSNPSFVHHTVLSFHLISI